jgi:hypothetical protein
MPSKIEESCMDVNVGVQIVVEAVGCRSRDAGGSSLRSSIPRPVRWDDGPVSNVAPASGVLVIDRRRR